MASGFIRCIGKKGIRFRLVLKIVIFVVGISVQDMPTFCVLANS